VDDADTVELGRALQQLLVASYGLHPGDLAREVADAAGHLGGEDVMVLLADYDQRTLVGFDLDDDRTFPIDGPGPGLAFRHETMVEESLGAGRRRRWLPAKDSAERLGVFGVVDDGSVPGSHWEAFSSLLGELIASKSHYGDHITLRRRGAPFSLAAEMRWALLPPLTFTSPDVTITGYLQPSHGIAGDAFDYGVTERTASIGIFDAVGHGIEASHLVDTAVGCYRHARRAGVDPVATLIAVDDAIATQFGDSLFVTAQVATFDLDSGRLEIANAGHPPPLHLRAGRSPEALACAPARPAGVGSRPSSFVTSIERGDAVLFQTDGIVEARSPDGEFFGDDRLAALVESLSDEGSTPAEILRRCLHAVVDHQRGRAGDDATLVLLRWSDDVRTATRAGRTG
jgi:serine phosphatase RsbU (regulator of sigma subunit)